MKKTRLLTITVVVTMLAAFNFWGCKPDNNNYPNYTEFVMHVDSIQHPSSLYLGSNLSIKFYGEIGPDGCYTFSRFSGKMQGREIQVTAYGKHEESTACDTAISYLYGATLTVSQLDTGRYVIHVFQPSPPDIYDTIYVRMRYK